MISIPDPPPPIKPKCQRQLCENKLNVKQSPEETARMWKVSFQRHSDDSALSWESVRSTRIRFFSFHCASSISSGKAPSFFGKFKSQIALFYNSTLWQVSLTRSFLCALRRSIESSNAAPAMTRKGAIRNVSRVTLIYSLGNAPLRSRLGCHLVCLKEMSPLSRGHFSNSSPCVITAQANNGLKGQNSTTESTVCLCLRKLNANCGKRGIWQVSLNERLEFWGGESQRIVAWLSAMALKVKSVCICFNNEEQTMAELKKKNLIHLGRRFIEICIAKSFFKSAV